MSIYVLLIIFFLYLVYLSMQNKQITIMIGKDTVLNCINDRKISSSRKLDSFSCYISDRSRQYSKKC